MTKYRTRRRTIFPCLTCAVGTTTTYRTVGRSIVVVVIRNTYLECVWYTSTMLLLLLLRGVKLLIRPFISSAVVAKPVLRERFWVLKADAPDMEPHLALLALCVCVCLRNYEENLHVSVSFFSAVRWRGGEPGGGRAGRPVCVNTNAESVEGHGGGNKTSEQPHFNLAALRSCERRDRIDVCI